MEQSQHQQSQQQWQGPERRQSEGAYEGENRRRQPPGAPIQEPSPDDGTRPLSTQDRKDEQQERTRQQANDQTDTH